MVYRSRDEVRADYLNHLSHKQVRRLECERARYDLGEKQQPHHGLQPRFTGYESIPVIPPPRHQSRASSAIVNPTAPQQQRPGSRIRLVDRLPRRWVLDPQLQAVQESTYRELFNQQLHDHQQQLLERHRRNQQEEQERQQRLQEEQERQQVLQAEQERRQALQELQQETANAHSRQPLQQQQREEEPFMSNLFYTGPPRHFINEPANANSHQQPQQHEQVQEQQQEEGPFMTNPLYIGSHHHFTDETANANSRQQPQQQDQEELEEEQLQDQPHFTDPTHNPLYIGPQHHSTEETQDPLSQLQEQLHEQIEAEEEEGGPFLPTWDSWIPRHHDFAHVDLGTNPEARNDFTLYPNQPGFQDNNGPGLFVGEPGHNRWIAYGHGIAHGHGHGVALNQGTAHGHGIGHGHGHGHGVALDQGTAHGHGTSHGHGTAHEQGTAPDEEAGPEDTIT